MNSDRQRVKTVWCFATTAFCADLQKIGETPLCSPAFHCVHEVSSRVTGDSSQGGAQGAAVQLTALSPALTVPHVFCQYKL